MLKTLKIKYLFLLGCCLFLGSQSYAQDFTDIQIANQYLQQGENDKALVLYEKLSGDPKNIPLIHESYFDLLLINGKLDEAEKYINKAIKRYPADLNFQIDKGIIYARKNDKGEEKKYYDRLIEQISDDQFKVRIAAQQFTRNQQFEYALETFSKSRKKLDDPYAYSIQMASLNRLLNNKEEMINEYLNYANQNPGNIESVKNIFQNTLREDEELELFENMMFQKVQKDPDSMIYGELLIWVGIQRKNFYSAFIQARAMDKRYKLNGTEIMQLGRIALVNKDYKNAVRIFEYITDNYPGTVNYQIASRLLIGSREEIVKNTFPVEKKEIEKLIKEYNKLIKDFGLNQNTIEALRSEALLYAFYLNEQDSAVSILQQIINTPRISKSIVDQSKLDLGDIYILTGEPWESALLYAQVEKSSKDTPIGYEAKLRNAKLSYYRGDFALAQNHLDVLKLATTREIANDAMALSLLIKDNTELDTADVAMKKYADIDLLIFQNKKDEALSELEALKSEFPDHPLVDEILYLEATLNLEMGNFTESIELLNQIVEQYGQDILADDALFLMCTIYEDQLSEKEKAQELYKQFLIDYPGSNKASEARKRFRILRGDFLQ
jgi:tetratricopeptide (TPR) repeat protein